MREMEMILGQKWAQRSWPRWLKYSNSFVYVQFPCFCTSLKRWLNVMPKRCLLRPLAVTTPSSHGSASACVGLCVHVWACLPFMPARLPEFSERYYKTTPHHEVRKHIHRKLVKCNQNQETNPKRKQRKQIRNHMKTKIV